MCVNVLGWVKCTEHISLLVIFCIIVYDKKKKNLKIPISDYGKMLNYRENIGKLIYRSISTFLAFLDLDSVFTWHSMGHARAKYLQLCLGDELSFFTGLERHE